MVKHQTPLAIPQKKPQKAGWREVLVISPKKRSQTTVRRHYLRWREEQGKPVRCDNSECQFHASALIWNGKNLPLILDHQNGNRCDNTPVNLRLLCPNCDAQLATRGGANRGRVIETVDGGYTLRNRDGSTIVARAGKIAGSSTVHGVGVAIHSESEHNPSCP